MATRPTEARGPVRVEGVEVTTFTPESLARLKSYKAEAEENSAETDQPYATELRKLVQETLLAQYEAQPGRLHVSSIHNVISKEEAVELLRIMNALKHAGTLGTSETEAGAHQLQARLYEVLSAEKLYDLSSVQLKGERPLTTDYYYPKARVETRIIPDGEGSITTIQLLKHTESGGAFARAHSTLTVEIYPAQIQVSIDTQDTTPYPVQQLENLGLQTLITHLHKASDVYNSKIQRADPHYLKVIAEIQELQKSLLAEHGVSDKKVWNKVQLHTHSHHIETLIAALQKLDTTKLMTGKMQDLFEELALGVIKSRNIERTREARFTADWQRIWTILEGSGVVAALLASGYLMKDVLSTSLSEVDSTTQSEFFLQFVILLVLLRLTYKRIAN